MDKILYELRSIFNLTDMLEAMVGWLPQLLSAIVMLALFYGLWRIVRRMAKALLNRGGMDATLGALVQSTLKTVVLAIGIVTALGQLGIDIAGLLTGVGVAGLTIGFAARDALSNMISGFFILWDRPFTIGDLIEIGEFYGRVEAITLRTTRVVTVDGKMLAIPNTEIVNKTVASYTNFPNLRLDVPFTVGVGENLARVREIALGLFQGNTKFKTSPPPVVVVTALNDYNIALELRAWLKDEKTHIAERLKLREQLLEALRLAQVDMPFETLTLSPVQVRNLTRE